LKAERGWNDKRKGERWNCCVFSSIKVRGAPSDASTRNDAIHSKSASFTSGVS